LQSQLIGIHQVGPLAVVAALAAELGLTDKQIEAGIAATQPFEHRMQPYQLDGAWVIDDTYNGNIEGIRAGTALLKTLPARRKIYVTPGLVDQGPETQRVHEEMGEFIAAAMPNIVVLMQNSVTKFIEAGLKTGGYSGELIIEKDPLHFYTNLSLFVAKGDLVLMQNDWTDNYH
jgi:UDP-N-acetylmuramyl pentapeptide synthase